MISLTQTVKLKVDVRFTSEYLQYRGLESVKEISKVKDNH